MNVPVFLILSALWQPPGVQPPAGAATVVPQRSGLAIAGIAFEPADIVSAAQGFDSYDATPNVLITFAERGRLKFQQAQEGRLSQPLEISVDGEVISSPILREIITGNQVTISGAFTIEEAQALARRIAPPR